MSKSHDDLISSGTFLAVFVLFCTLAARDA